MLDIPFHNMDIIEEAQEEMSQFREDFKNTFGVYPRQSSDKPDDNGEYYYCGLCRCMMHISHFPH